MFCYQNGFANPTQPVDEERFYALVRAKAWKDVINKYRQTHDPMLKRRLPAFIFQSVFDETPSKNGKKGRWRKQSATRLTGLVVMDIDHVDNPQQVYESWRRLDFAALGILLVYVTPSGHGIKVVFKADTERGNLIDNQHHMARVLGVEVDESCKDASRMSFICREEDLLFIDKQLFTYENKAFGEKYDEDYRAGNSRPTASESRGEMKGEAEGEVKDKGEAEDKAEVKNDTLFKGHEYKEIIDEWWRQNGGVPQQGERNVKLYQLAVSLRAICDNSKERLMDVMPRLGLSEQEMKSIVESACKETPKGLTRPLREVLSNIGITTSEAQREAQPEREMDQRLWEWGGQIERMAEQFPWIKDICKGLKRNQYPAAIFVAGGLMMTLMTRCTYRFYHRPEELRRLNNSTLIIGDPASGKSFATRLFNLLAAPIAEADRKGIGIINDYREQMKTKGANKEKPKKPKVVVRLHPARTSNAQFIQDMVNAVEVVDGQEMQLHMFTFDTELDNTVSLQKGGSWIDKQSMELKAFHNEEDGQAYSNVDSILQNFNVTWNFIYTGTPIALKKKVNERNFGSGLATRLTCVPLPATNFQMIERERGVDLESDNRLKAWAYKLDRTKGLLPLDSIVDKLYDWTARRMMDAMENASKADEMLLKRCAYHGVNFSAPFIVMRHWDMMKEEGGYWCGDFQTDDADWSLAEMIANIQFACQRYYFGAMAEDYFDNKMKEASVNVQRRQKTVEGFKQLPEEFTADDVMRCFGVNSESAARMKITRLIGDHLVEKVSDGRQPALQKSIYRKTGRIML